MNVVVVDFLTPDKHSGAVNRQYRAPFTMFIRLYSDSRNRGMLLL